MHVVFLINIFRFHSGLKIIVEPNSDRLNLFLFERRCWDAKFSTHEVDTSYKFGGNLVMWSRTWSLNFVTPKNIHNMQYYMMLLEQCEYIVEKVLVTAT